jgi:hypothetical protein
VTITNDLTQPVVLQLCDSFGCGHLNDRLLPGVEIAENVSTSLNPYNFLVVDDAGRELGCLQVATDPVPVDPVPVSSLGRGDSVPCR